MSECTHTLEERWNDCSDGACPFCCAAELDRLNRDIEVKAKLLTKLATELDRLRAENAELLVYMNLLRDALSWFDAHNIDHLPQWVDSTRAILAKHKYEPDAGLPTAADVRGILKPEP